MDREYIDNYDERLVTNYLASQSAQGAGDSNVNNNNSQNVNKTTPNNQTSSSSSTTQIPIQDKPSDVVAACEIIKDRFYFATLRCKPRSTSRTHYFNIDQELIYENFYSDFGPLNLSHVYRYCSKVNKKLKSYSLQKKKIVHYTSETPNYRVNAAFLAGCYQIIYLNKPANDVYKLLISSTKQQHQMQRDSSNSEMVNIHLTHHSSLTRNVLAQKCNVYKAYRDAALGPPLYLLTMFDCLIAIEKAKAEGWLDFENFNVDEYEYYERVENGDLNWLVPGQFIAFCGPHQKSKIEDGYPLHSPESYFPLFRKYNVQDIVRLNRKMYKAERFSDAGFTHHDLFFIDGSCPSEEILQRFIKIAEHRLKPEHGDRKIAGVLAVHCKAGLGRTGTLIAAYIMKHYRWTANQIIAWLRINRPGSVIGPQQIYLEEIQAKMYREGDEYRRKLGVSNEVSRNQASSSSFSSSVKQPGTPNMSVNEQNLYKTILESETTASPNGLTQGDRLRAVKVMSQKTGTTNQMVDVDDETARPMTRSRSKVDSMPSDTKHQKTGTATPSTRQRTTRVTPNSRNHQEDLRPRSVSHEYRTSQTYKTVPDVRRATADNHEQQHQQQYNQNNHHQSHSSKSINPSSSIKPTPSSSSSSPFASTAKYKHVAPPTTTGQHQQINTNNSIRGSSSNANSGQTGPTTPQLQQGSSNSKSRRNPSPRIAAEMAKMKIANSVNYR